MTGWLSDRITAVSRGVAEAYISSGVVCPLRTHVLPNGIDIDEWKPDESVKIRVRREFSLTGEFLWCAVGRLESVKDYPTLLRAMQGLPEDAHLAIAGSGNEETGLRELAAELGLAKRVHFLGFQPDVRRWIQGADAVVLSSLWEGLPMSLLEAGACGLPCVTTGVPGSREIVVDGVTGFLTEAGSVDSLRSTMLRMMQMQRENRRSMGMHARQRIVEVFGLDAVLDQWEKVYCEVLLQNPLPRRYAGGAAGKAFTSIGVPSKHDAAASARWP